MSSTVNKWSSPIIPPRGMAGSYWDYYKVLSKTSKVTAPQDAHGRLVLQVYLGSDTLEFSAIRR